MSLGKAGVHARRQSMAKLGVMPAHVENHAHDGLRVVTTQALQTPVLVLNASYEPINICGARRALVLVLKGVARTEEEQATELHSARVRMAMPSVIRLLEYRRIPHQTRALSRKNILLRDRNTCQYCGVVLPSAELTLDHVVPRSRGGLSDLGKPGGGLPQLQSAEGESSAQRDRPQHEAAARAAAVYAAHEPAHHAHDRPFGFEVEKVFVLLAGSRRLVASVRILIRVQG